MAFNKTGIAIDTRVIDPQESLDRPVNPEVGDLWQDLVWDGEAWVSVSIWAMRQANDQPEE